MNRLAASAVILTLALTSCARPAGQGGREGDGLPRPVMSQRIVALSPSSAELLFALGLGPRVVGVSDFCDWPPEARRLPSVGSFINPSLEAVAALRPDLCVVAASGVKRSSLERLRELGIDVRTCEAKTVVGMIDGVARLAGWCGVPEAGERLSGELVARLEGVRAAVAGLRRPRVFLQLSCGSLYTAGGGSLQGDLIAEAGGVNVAAAIPGPYPRLSLEQVLTLAPDVILVACDDAAAFNRERRRWLALPIPAAHTGAVYRLRVDTIQRPGPRLLEGLELVAATLHPGCLRAVQPSALAAGGS